MEDRYLSLAEVAGLLAVSERTVQRWIHSGRLEAYRPGRDYRIPESAVKALLEEGKVSPKERRASLEQSFNGLLAEERRASWEAAVENARRLREDGRERMAELLEAWHKSKRQGEDPSKRRPNLDGIGILLQDAYDAETALAEIALVGSRALSENTHIGERWPEVRKAGHFYGELWRMVQERGLRIRTSERTSEASDQEEMRPGRVVENVA